MTENKLKPVLAEAIRRLASPFFVQGSTTVYVARCCNFLYVGGTKQSLCCGDCKKTVEPTEVKSVAEAEALGV